jgi:hypothetical protein
MTRIPSENAGVSAVSSQVIADLAEIQAEIVQLESDLGVTPPQGSSPIPLTIPIVT